MDCRIVLALLLVVTHVCAHQIYLDVHCHAKDVISKPGEESLWSPEQAVDWHIGNGYNAMFITNHEPDDIMSPQRLRALSEYRKDRMLILPGREISYHNFHLLVLFEPKTYCKHYAAFSHMFGNGWCIAQWMLDELLQQAHARGAVVVWAHPHLYANRCGYSLNMSNVDYRERITMGIPDLSPPARWPTNKFVAGTDGHSFTRTFGGGYTRMSVDEWDPQAVFEVLRNGTVWVEIAFTRIDWLYWAVLLGAFAGWFLLCLVGIWICTSDHGHGTFSSSRPNARASPANLPRVVQP